MRILTVLSGILLAAAGAFCFTFNTHPFSDMAFLVGIAMVASGALILTAFISAAKKHHISDTMLVEGIICLLFGFAVLNNQISDTMLTVFFGAWLAIAGANRISQGYAVSRYNPKDWFKILPLSAIDAILGTVMMMPKLTSSTPSNMLIALAFIINGLSLLVYAMYIKPPATAQKHIEAMEREEARMLATKAKREKRDEMRSLSNEERLAAQEAAKQKKQEEKLAKRKAREEEKAARKASQKPDPSKTIQLTKDEVDEINEAAEASGFAAAAAAAEAVIEAADTIEEALVIEAEEPQPQVEEAPVIESEPEEDINFRPVFKRPTDIPVLLRQNERGSGETAVADDIKISAVNLEEVEAALPAVEFEKPELPEIETVSVGGEAQKRAEILEWLANSKPEPQQEEAAEYTPISLDELIRETEPKAKDDRDDKRFTQTLSFNWVNNPNVTDDNR